MAAVADPAAVQMSVDDFDPGNGPGRRSADQQLFGIGQLGASAIGAQLGQVNASLASLQTELHRSLNGLEKVVDRGLESLALRMDRQEARQTESEKLAAASMARLEALEEWKRDEEKRQNAEARDAAASTAQLQKDSARLATWQILVAVFVGMLGLVGTIAGIVSALS